MARRRRWLPIWMVLALVLTVAFPGRAPAWSNIGPLGGEVEEVAVAGPEGEHIYVMTPGGSFWVSDDGGRSFEERARGRFPFYGPFVVDPGDPSHLWAATPEEVLVSRDGGGHWSSFGSFSAAVAVDDMVLDPWIPGAVDVTVAEYGRGASFRGMVRFLPDGSRQVVLDQASGPLAAGDGVLYALRAGELVQSSDGKNWDGAADPGVEAITALAVDPGDGRHVVAGGPEGLAVSLDGGATWRRTEIHERVHAVVFGPGVAWCATGAGLWISTSDGLWWDRTSLQGGWLACVAADPSDQGTVYVGTREAPAGFDRPGLMRSNSFGQSFRMSDTGIVATGVFSVSLAATGAGPRLLALTDDFSLVAWNGNGFSWRVLGPGDGGRVNAFSRDPGDDRRLLAVSTGDERPGRPASGRRRSTSTQTTRASSSSVRRVTGSGRALSQRLPARCRCGPFREPGSGRTWELRRGSGIPELPEGVALSERCPI